MKEPRKDSTSSLLEVLRSAHPEDIVEYHRRYLQGKVPTFASWVWPGMTGLMAITFTESAADVCSVVLVAVFQLFEAQRVRRLQEGQRAGTVAAPVKFEVG